MAMTLKALRARKALDDALQYQMRLLKACEPLLSFLERLTDEDYAHYAKRFNVEVEDLRTRFVTL